MTAQRTTVRLTPAKSSGKQAEAGSASRSLDALVVAEEKLRTAWREIENLRILNMGLVRQLAEVSGREAQARRLAHRDVLTGLCNRQVLMERLQSAIADASQQQRQLALLFIDLDGFKEVNDRFGHAAGDRLLKVVAARIAACARTTDVVCRYGGDEFVLVLPGMDDTAVAERIADKIRLRIAQPYSIDGNKFHVTASIGVAVYPCDAEQGEALLSRADQSMYRDKAAMPFRFENRGTDSPTSRNRRRYD